MVFHISFYIVITSKIAFSFSSYAFCLWNSSPTTIDFSCKICTQTSCWLYLSLFPTFTTKVHSFFAKPLSYVYTPSMFFDIVVLFRSIPLYSSSTLAIFSIEPSTPPTSSSSFYFLWSTLAFWHSPSLPFLFSISFSHLSVFLFFMDFLFLLDLLKQSMFLSFHYG